MAMTAGDATLKAIRDTNKISALLNGAKIFQSQAEEVKEEQLEEDSTPTTHKKVLTEDETRA